VKNASSPLLFAIVIAAIAFACARSSPSPGPHEAREDPTRCATCHTPEFVATKSPPHANVRPSTCGVCHTQASWHPFRVAHPWWELTGAHAKAAADRELAGKEQQVKCFWCHRGEPSTFKDTKKECIACHAEDRAMSKFPGHDQFETTCESCHSTTAWKPTLESIALPTARAPALMDASAPLDAAIADAGHDAARPRVVTQRPSPPRVPTASPTPTVPPPPRAPPDVTSRASSRR
jgi:hypothetical protein